MKSFKWMGIFLVAVALLAYPTRLYSQIQSANDTLLYDISSLQINDIDMPSNRDSIIRSMLKIEIIDKQFFDEKKLSNIVYFQFDTLNFKKKNGVITLPLRKGKKQFRDKPELEETHTEFTYLGQIPFLNVYIIGGLYWEDLDYKFISKNNGDEMAYFLSFPQISADKKSVVAIAANPYERAAELGLYSISKQKITLKLSAIFKHWMPMSEGIFWGNDGWIYVPFQFSDQYWSKDGNVNSTFLYLRMKPLPAPK